MGCGDGKVLLELYTLVRDSTERGRHLGTHPLTCIGADVSAIALEAAEQTFTSAGVPYVVCHGDINEPEQFEATLLSHGARR